jgi:ParB-like chromosome segregation protein Spo0J
MAASNSSANLVITYLALTALVVDRRNPRRYTPSQIKQIARSVEAFGFAVPILVEGHGRFLAAQLLGLVDVPVVAFVSERDSLASRCEA